MQHDLAIRMTGPNSAKIRLDGRNIENAVYGFNIDSAVGLTPVATMRVKFYELGYEGKPLVVIPDETRELLIALGWTPPGEEGHEPQHSLEGHSSER